MDSIETFNAVCPPKLMVFDMRTDRMVKTAVTSSRFALGSRVYKTGASRFTAEERHAAAGDPAAQHAADQSGDRRPDRRVPSAGRVPG